jgi:hypothetical protein
MKVNIKRHLFINAELDSSEAIMFTQGSKYTIDLKHEYAFDPEEFDDIKLSFYIERSENARFNFITGEAKKHREYWDNIKKEDEESKLPKQENEDRLE